MECNIEDVHVSFGKNLYLQEIVKMGIINIIYKLLSSPPTTQIYGRLVFLIFIIRAIYCNY